MKFKSVQELQERIDAYFELCWETNDEGKRVQTRPYTITGLALALDTNRQTLVNYEEKEEYFDAIKRAKLMCENYVEEGMLTNKLNSTASIFNMKNNYGWKDKTEQDITTQGDKIGNVDITDAQYERIIRTAAEKLGS